MATEGLSNVYLQMQNGTLPGFISALTQASSGLGAFLQDSGFFKAFSASQKAGNGVWASIGAGLTANPLALVSLVANAVVSLYEVIEKKRQEAIAGYQEEARAQLEKVNADKEEIKSNNDKIKSYSDLLERYKEGEDVSIDLRNSAKELIEAYGLEEHTILSLTDSYASYSKFLDTVNEQKQKNLELSRAELSTEKTLAKENLRNIA